MPARPSGGEKPPLHLSGSLVNDTAGQCGNARASGRREGPPSQKDPGQAAAGRLQALTPAPFLAGGGLRESSAFPGQHPHPNPSPCAQGEGLAAPDGPATIGVAALEAPDRIARRLPSPAHRERGWG
jgi:hypothetical protein